MNKQERNRETRRQNALDRHGTNSPRCTICGETDWRCLEAHHVAGRAYDDLLVTICRNCHRKASDDQKDHPNKNADPPGLHEIIGHFLLGLADFLVLLVEKLRHFGSELLAEVANETSNEGASR